MTSALVLRLGYALSLSLAASPFAAKAADPPVVTIDVKKFAFVPADLTIAPGTRVRWINRDETPHTVADEAKAFVSPALDTDQDYGRVFDSPGDVKYYCTLHPFMAGALHIRTP